MIEVSGLTKIYGTTIAVEDLSFSVEKGEVLGFLGPNGAGKTTTMRVITCFQPATRGTVKVSGYDVFSDSIEVRRRVGYLPENIPLYGEMSVLGYLDYVAELKGIDKSVKKSRISETMETCGISDVGHRLIGKLSKGYSQRVGLAQALVSNPDVLILDEPTVGLDPKQIIEVRELIRSMAGDRTIILSTHILPEVSQTCQRVVIINKGKMVVTDTPENLTAKLRGSQQVRAVVRGLPDKALDVASKVPGVSGARVEEDRGDGTLSVVVDSELERDIRENLSAAFVGSGMGLVELTSVGMSLEDIYLKLTTEEEVSR
jgi:ABC-2 type transport system ATP-binding protein